MISETTSKTGSTTPDQLDGLSKSAYERRIQRLEDEKKELLRKLENSNRALQNFAHGPLADNDSNRTNNESAANEVRRLQDDVNTLTKKNAGEFRVTKKWTLVSLRLISL